MYPIRLFQRPIAFALAFLIALSSMSCYSRVRMSTSRLPKIQDIKGLKFVLIDASSPITHMWNLTNPKFEKDSLSANLNRASEVFGIELTNIRSNSDQGKNQDLVLIYLKAEKAKSLADSVSTQISYTDITKIEVFEPDAAEVIGCILIGLGSLAAIALIALIIACNCPHVYSEAPDGSRELEGSLYSGAIYPVLERSDYLPLDHLQAVDNQYNIWLVNQESQRQHTNLAALEVIDHAPGIQPVFDKYGILHTLSFPQMPFEAIDNAGKNVLHEIAAKDQKAFYGDLDHPDVEGIEKLSLHFSKPVGAKQAKLVIRAKTDPWVDYVYHEFQNALGQYADAVHRKYSQKTAAQNQAWMEDQKLPIAVWLETSPGQWRETEHFSLAGASAFRDDVLPIDLSMIQGDAVHIRLEFGFHFWEIDRVALDFTEDQAVQQTTLRPLLAQNELGQDVTTRLTDDDDQYYDQPNIGDEARLHFEVPALAPGHERSLVLHAKGHYEVLHQNAPGRPGLSRLNAWKKENALPKLSVARWQSAKSLSISH